uniref:Mucin-2-like n=1 Tax=Echinostoma caproni TaxID=27848 RepID=A0A183AKM4_9TREM
LTIRDGRVGDLAIVYLGDGCWRPLLLPPEVEVVTKSKVMRSSNEEEEERLYDHGPPQSQKQQRKELPVQQRTQHPVKTQKSTTHLHAHFQSTLSDTAQFGDQFRTILTAPSNTNKVDPNHIGTVPVSVSLYDLLRQKLAAVNPVLMGLLPNTGGPVQIPDTVPAAPTTAAAGATTILIPATPSNTPTVAINPIPSTSTPCITLNPQTYTLIPITVPSHELNRK